MKKFFVEYRGEFGVEVSVKNVKEAIGKFRKKLEDFITGELWDCFFEVFNENGREVYQNK